MSEKPRWWGLGQRIAPPRFVLFVLLFVVATAVLWPMIGKGRAVMTGFDLGAAAFLASLAPLFSYADTDRMRRTTRANDANRGVLLAITGATSAVILVAVHGELQGKNDALAIAIVIVTLALAWLFSNMVYALHYAHVFYADDDGDDAGGIDFPKTDEPDYWDFLYFSYTLGMTFQTSDVQITARRVRRIAIGQCLLAFVFNLGILAFTINTLGGGGS